VYGRVPNILPGIDQLEALDGAAAAAPGLISHTHRLREISIQAMVEGSARARLGRAMNTRTTIAAQTLNLQTGEEVDFYREQTSKDASGWFGPAEVADVSRATRGVVTVRYNNRLCEVQTQHIRRHLHFWTFLAAPSPHATVHENVWAFIKRKIEQVSEGSTKQLGAVWHRGKWIHPSAVAHFPGLMNAVKFLLKTTYTCRMLSQPGLGKQSENCRRFLASLMQ
jgi:hypothetical protein